MGFGLFIAKQREKFAARRRVQEDIKHQVAQGKIKKLGDVRKKYEQGSYAYKTARDEVVNTQVKYAEEDAMVKAKLKAAKEGRKLTQLGNFSQGLARVTNQNTQERRHGLDLHGGDGSQGNPFSNVQVRSDTYRKRSPFE